MPEECPQCSQIDPATFDHRTFCDATTWPDPGNPIDESELIAWSRGRFVYYTDTASEAATLAANGGHAFTVHSGEGSSLYFQPGTAHMVDRLGYGAIVPNHAGETAGDTGRLVEYAPDERENPCPDCRDGELETLYRDGGRSSLSLCDTCSFMEVSG